MCTIPILRGKKENNLWKVNMGYCFLAKSEVAIDLQLLSATDIGKIAKNDDFEEYTSSLSTESITSRNSTESN